MTQDWAAEQGGDRADPFVPRLFVCYAALVRSETADLREKPR
jgi:hypothetical protein